MFARCQSYKKNAKNIYMKPKWLIQTNMDGVDTKSMIAAVKNQGMGVYGIEYDLGKRIDFGKLYDTTISNDCVICYGDISFIGQIRRKSAFVPGAYCNFENMKCSIYYAYFGEFLLNKDYIILPLGDLPRRLGSIVYPYRTFFIRPDSGTKPFTGYHINYDHKNKIQTLLETSGPETLVVVSQLKEITNEWRFVICNRKVVAGSQYLPIESSVYPPSSYRLAEIIASQDWQPDICYTVDIAESEGKMHLLEINSFSCAGFYNCNIEDIVRYASIAAREEWKDCYEI